MGDVAALWVCCAHCESACPTWGRGRAVQFLPRGGDTVGPRVGISPSPSDPSVILSFDEQSAGT